MQPAWDLFFWEIRGTCSEPMMSAPMMIRYQHWIAAFALSLCTLFSACSRRPAPKLELELSGCAEIWIDATAIPTCVMPENRAIRVVVSGAASTPHIMRWLAEDERHDPLEPTFTATIAGGTLYHLTLPAQA